MSEEISEFDENCVTVKKADPENLLRAATRGWKTCSFGFDDSLEQQSSPLFSTNKRRQRSLDYTSINFEPLHKRASTPKLKRDAKRNFSPSNDCVPRTPKTSKNVIEQTMIQKENVTLKNKCLDLDIHFDTSNSLKAKKFEKDVKCKNVKKWAFLDLSNNFDVQTVRRNELDSSKKSNDSFAGIEEIPSSESYSPVISDYISDSSNKSSQPIRESPSRTYRTTSFQIGQSVSSAKIMSSLPRGTDWLRTLRESDYVSSPMTEEKHVGEKTHHSRNFVLGGFAQQSCKLENRETTSLVLWRHQKPEKTKKHGHKCLKVLLETCNSVDGFLLSKCKVLERPSSQGSSPSTCSSDGSISLSLEMAECPDSVEETVNQQHVKEQWKSNDLDSPIQNNYDYCQVVFKMNLLKKLPNVGSVVWLFPPWQSIQIPMFANPTILSSYFIEVSKSPIQKTSPTITEIILPRYSKNELLESAKKTALLSRLPHEGLHINSRPPYVVTVLGKIIDVDREGAMTWLRCAGCSRTELFQDTQNHVFCPQCNKFTKTVLIMKVKAFVSISELPNASVSVELTSETAKRILSLSDSEIQPERDVSCILNKEVGPIQCRIISRKEVDGDKVIFRLKEMKS